jgi:hypothetical protein
LNLPVPHTPEPDDAINTAYSGESIMSKPAGVDRMRASQRPECWKSNQVLTHRKNFNFHFACSAYCAGQSDRYWCLADYDYTPSAEEAFVSVEYIMRMLNTVDPRQTHWRLLRSS